MKILSIYAHPADTITNCGGTLALHAQRGDEVVAIILTHGGRVHPNKYAEEWRQSNPDAVITAAGLADIIQNKKRELERAAKIVGISRVITLDREDNTSTLDEELIHLIAQHIAAERPDVIICDYPLNFLYDPHTLATQTVLAAVGQASLYLQNLDGRSEFHLKQIFFTNLPVSARNCVTTGGLRNDLLIDITDVVGAKIAAMDEFVSQGYNGNFARKLVESHNGEFGRLAGVNFAEAYVRYYNETHQHLPVTEAANRDDGLTRHVTYSEQNVRAMFPITN